MTLFKTSPVRSPCKIYRESIKKFILYRQSVQYVLKKIYKYIGSNHFFQIPFSSNNINAFCNRKCLVSYVGMHHIVPPRSIMPCAEL